LEGGNVDPEKQGGFLFVVLKGRGGHPEKEASNNTGPACGKSREAGGRGLGTNFPLGKR